MAHDPDDCPPGCPAATPELPAQPAPLFSPECGKHGVPQVRNPHPDAGAPGRVVEVGAVYECVPCLAAGRHSAWERAMAAEAESARLAAALEAAERRIAAALGALWIADGEYGPASHLASEVRAALSGTGERGGEKVKDATEEEPGETGPILGSLRRALGEAERSAMEHELTHGSPRKKEDAGGAD